MKFAKLDLTTKSIESPSTRRVWIEIAVRLAFNAFKPVTLHTEGVD